MSCHTHGSLHWNGYKIVISVYRFLVTALNLFATARAFTLAKNTSLQQTVSKGAKEESEGKVIICTKKVKNRKLKIMIFFKEGEVRF